VILVEKFTGKDLYEMLRYLQDCHPEAVNSSQIIDNLKWGWGEVEKLLRYARNEGWVHSGIAGCRMTAKGIDKYNNWIDKDNELVI